MNIDMGVRIAGKQDIHIYEIVISNCFPFCTYVSTVMRPAFSDILVPRCPWNVCKGLTTLGKPIMMFRVNFINYLVKLHLKCINEYCIRISEILCIIKCVVMIDMKTRHILFW